jgi:hypothetical protein
MSNAEEFMKEARQTVAARNKTLTHKVRTMAWYTGRDVIRHAPESALKKVGAAIPFPGVGAAVNWGIDKAITKVQKARKAKKRVAYQLAAEGGDLEALRKHAKADAKDQTTLAEKIDSNLVKLKDAAQAADDAIGVFLRVSPPTKESAWTLACALYDSQHYEDKLHVLVEKLKERLEAVEEYIEARRAKTVAQEEDLTVLLEEMEEAGVDIASQEQARPRSPSGDGRLG